jgi:hypothetical protein
MGGSGGTAGMVGVTTPSGHSGSCAVSLGERSWTDALWLLVAPVAGVVLRRIRRSKRGAR